MTEMNPEINININDIEYLLDMRIYTVFWRGIRVGTIEKVKKTKYTPEELIGKWECGYTANDFHDTQELAAIKCVRKYLKYHPDRIDGPKNDDLLEAEKYKSFIEHLKRLRVGDYGSELNVVKEDFKKWCIGNNIRDEKFQNKVIEDYMFFILGFNSWPLTQENQSYNQYIRNVGLNFLKHLILIGVSIRTFRQHSDNLSAIAHDILEKMKSEEVDASTFKETFLHDIKKSSENPPDYNYIDKEGHDKRYRSTCKKLISFIESE